ncbi:hypothetical protein D3C86_1998010 [compost metagenome]
MRIPNFDIVTKNPIEIDFQTCDPGSFDFALAHFIQKTASFILYISKMIQFFGNLISNDISFVDVNRKLIVQMFFNKIN